MVICSKPGTTRYMCGKKLNRTAVDLTRPSTGPLQRTSVSQKAWIARTSPVITTVAVCRDSKDSRELVAQCLSDFKIGRVEARGEPAVDRREEVSGLGSPVWPSASLSFQNGISMR